MRQLGQQAERAVQRRVARLPVWPLQDVHAFPPAAKIGTTRYNSRSLLSANPRSSADASAWMRSRGAANVAARSSTIAANVACAGAALEDLHRDRVGLEHPLGREQDPAALRFIVGEAHAARQPRLRVGARWRAAVSFTLSPPGTKAPGRHVPGRHIGVVERVELRPQHIAFEFQRGEHGLLGLGGAGVAPDIVEGEIGVLGACGGRLSK